jgi:hypothetical protein
LKRISLMKKKKKKKEARHLQSLVDSISRKKREKWTKFFFSFRRRGIKIIKIFTCDTFIRHLSEPDLFPTQRGLISAQLLAQWPPRIWFGQTGADNAFCSVRQHGPDRLPTNEAI